MIVAHNRHRLKTEIIIILLLLHMNERQRLLMCSAYLGVVLSNQRVRYKKTLQEWSLVIMSCRGPKEYVHSKGNLFVAKMYSVL